MAARFPIWCARLRMPLLWGALALLVAGALLGGLAWMGPAGLVLLVAGLALYFRVGTVRRPPVEVAAPVAGRWQAINSPADKVPSHGLHAYGQTYAIDLVHKPVGGNRPEFGTGPSFRPPEDFPAFDQPILAPAGGVVVRAHGRERDHRSRSSWPSLLYLFAEGSPRELTGPGARQPPGHRLGDGVHAVLAHLRRGSLRVAKGQRVRAGEQVAACGNSGNSTEPHLHFQLMDHRSILFGAGLPFRLASFEVDGTVQAGVPANGRPFTTGGPADTDGDRR
ncbi:MAG TPA: M23 family metallopeptidase [Actinomycetota bacterium]|nr:M23 family metallopeptidase [Actinomycetota bacterium]